MLFYNLRDNPHHHLFVLIVAAEVRPEYVQIKRSCAELIKFPEYEDIAKKKGYHLRTAPFYPHKQILYH